MKKLLFIVLPIVVAYIIGALTIKYKLPPYSLMKKLLNYELVVDNSILSSHFVKPLAKGVSLRYPPIRDIQQLNTRISELLVNIDDFGLVYQDIDVLASKIENSILIITYEYNGIIDTSFAYFKKAVGNSNVGVNIIPGSGINQSSEIFYNSKIEDNYQCNIDDIAIKFGDCFIYIKPNEDILAIHNGKNKIDETSFVNYLINNGGSYSAHYIVQSLALSKYINSNYNELYVCGLSQGGLAALINSLQSEPDKAIIASGFSVITREPYRSGFNQIIIPNFRKTYHPDSIKIRIGRITTKFLFTYGLDEKGIYGKDANENLTKEFLKGFANVSFSIHPKGHIYYEPYIVDFFKN